MVIVGAGECGTRAALALRENGDDGPVTLIGAEPHPPYERPPLSKDVITCEARPAARIISGAASLAEAGVEHLRSTTVDGIDRENRTLTLAGGERIGYDRLLLATGATPRRLPLAGADDPRCRTLRTFDDALAIRAHIDASRSLAILGGGFIGLELAASARRRGVPVTVIEAEDRLMKRGVPEEIAAQLAARHREEGVDIRCGTGLTAVTPAEDGLILTLGDGTTLTTNLLVIAIGVVPETALAAAAGLALDNGIAVDDRLKTSDPHIFAAGDCCSFPAFHYGGRRVRLEAWRSAQEQGTLAARNMLGADEALTAVPWFWSDQYDLGLQIAGLAEGAATMVRRDCSADAFILFHLAADGRLLAASGIGPGTTVGRDIRLAEMLIARRACPTPAELAAPEVRLKALLAA
jgi:3-phenylpropionate/trans-cinnamate dioxygenase ferredoxin reductase subunit